MLLNQPQNKNNLTENSDTLQLQNQTTFNISIVHINTFNETQTTLNPYDIKVIPFQL